MVEVALLGVNDIGEWVSDWLSDRSDATVATIIETKEGLSSLHDIEPDLLISAGFRAIVPEEYLDLPPLGAVNLHKSYLPYNRGANPNVWSIVEDNPAGVSIHYMTPTIDGGGVIDRRRVEIAPDDTAKDLYNRLEAAQREQFVDVWPDLKSGAEAVEQSSSGTYHEKSDFVDLWELNRDEEMRVGELIDRLRALTFPPFRNAFFEVDGRKYYVEIDVVPESEDPSETPSERSIPTYDAETGRET